MKKSKVYIIAEAGVNHNGDIRIAKALVDVAADCGADCVKFQSFIPKKLVSRLAPKAEYQLQTTNVTESQLDMLEKLKLTKEMHEELISYCKLKEIEFLSTPFEEDSLQYLIDLGMEVIKIPSGEITNYPYLKRIGLLGKKVILSTGMSTLNEVVDAVNILKEFGSKDIILLHCNTQYPTPYEDVNLNAMMAISEATSLPVGYSDHTGGIEVPIAAVAMGAVVIEKHFTLDKKMEGPDHKASLEPYELKEMVKAIRNIEKAMGDGIKKASQSEVSNAGIVRKSIIASKNIKKGEEFTEENLTTKRPGNGINPMRWNEVLGTKAIRDFEEDELIETI